jgi:hypothetical protein
MKVDLKQTWFAPTDIEKIDRLRTRGGVRYRAGEHELPDHLYKYLPSRTKILVPPANMDATDWKPTLKRDVEEAANLEGMENLEKRAAEEYQRLHDEAEATRKAARAEVLEKARAAKAAKKAAREASETQGE